MGALWELYGNYMGICVQARIFYYSVLKWTGLFFREEFYVRINALRSLMRTNFASKSRYAYKTCFVRITEGTCTHDAQKVRLCEQKLFVRINAPFAHVGSWSFDH